VTGGAYAALYSALDWDLEELVTPASTTALLACVARPRKAVGYAVGTQGTVLCRDGDSQSIETVSGEPLLSTVAFDPFGRPWAATTSRIFMRSDTDGWIEAYRGEGIETPFVSLFLDVGLCIGMTADGAVIEGRSARAGANMSDIPPPPL
jgi:hypothetical protein